MLSLVWRAKSARGSSSVILRTVRDKVVRPLASLACPDPCPPVATPYLAFFPRLGIGTQVLTLALHKLFPPPETALLTLQKWFLYSDAWAVLHTAVYCQRSMASMTSFRVFTTPADNHWTFLFIVRYLPCASERIH